MTANAAGVDADGMPHECCDYWPECSHVYYAVQAWDAATRRMQHEHQKQRDQYSRLLRDLDKAEDWDADHGFVLPGDCALAIVLHLDVQQMLAEHVSKEPA